MHRADEKNDEDDDVRVLAATTTTTTTDDTAVQVVVVEQRAKRFRTSCPAALRERWERAATQRLYLVHQSEIPPLVVENERIGGGETKEEDEEEIAAVEEQQQTHSQQRSSEQQSINSSQQDYSVTFAVLGSTGNVYTVVLSHVPCCNCPDFIRRQDMCKHILFVLLKVVGLENNNNAESSSLSSLSPLGYQQAYITSELTELFTMLRARRVGGSSVSSSSSSMANEQVLAAYAAASATTGASIPTSPSTSTGSSSTFQGVPRRSLQSTDDDSSNDCPICFDELSLHDMEGQLLTYCRGTCGANFHTACIERWLGAAAAYNNKPSCPNCRQPWITAGGAVFGSKKNVPRRQQQEVYTNLGDLQGQSSSRDTSTYHDYDNKRRRRR